MRNDFGNIFSQTVLPRRTLSADDVREFLGLANQPEPTSSETDDEAATPTPSGASAASIFYPGRLLPNLSAGGEFRLSNLSRFGMAASDSTNSFDVGEANVYAHLFFLDGAAGLYLDETVGPGGAAAREVYGLVRGPWGTYAKAGRMMLPFGLRLQDDAAFIREVTGFNYGVQDLGVEVGAEPGPFSLSVSFSNGTQGSTDNNKDKQVAGVASFIQRHWRIGGSASTTSDASSRQFGLYITRVVPCSSTSHASPA